MGDSSDHRDCGDCILLAQANDAMGLSNQLCNCLISEHGQRHALFPKHHLEALQRRLPVVNLLPVA